MCEVWLFKEEITFRLFKFTGLKYLRSNQMLHFMKRLLFSPL